MKTSTKIGPRTKALTPFVAIVFDLITNSTDAFGGTYDSNINKKKHSTILPQNSLQQRKKNVRLSLSLIKHHDMNKGQELGTGG